MKVIRYGLCLILFFAFIACSNELDDKLEGKWQLQQIEANGNIISKVDTVFYNFQTSLFMYQIYLPGSNSFSNCYGFKTVTADKQLLLELTPYGVPVDKFLPRTDWKSKEREFKVDHVNGNSLVLSSDNKQYVFRKF
ncbi:hypothetical protein FACS189431_7710 [Alphaproteobacteria bacterium]|nr:hypothetical protein FACS189431_7710 [Alphaproteobacteria bacterium]